MLGPLLTFDEAASNPGPLAVSHAGPNLVLTPGDIFCSSESEDDPRCLVLTPTTMIACRHRLWTRTSDGGVLGNDQRDLVRECRWL